jgi:serine/threonine protein kinase
MSNDNKKPNNYEPVNSDINKKSVSIIRDKNTGVLYVQKTLTIFDLDVYKYLHEHPIKNIPKIIDYDLKNDTLTIIEEYIEGITLADYLENRDIDIKTFYSHIYKLCDIIKDLQNANNINVKNEKSIIHRDIKPSNIIITPDNNLYLIDLNAAKFYKPSEDKDTTLIGTEEFAAPEQYGFGSSNKATDIYAIGSLMKHYLTYFNDNDFAKRINPIIDKCMKIDYKDRYGSIFELKADLFRSEHNIMNFVLPGFRSFNFLHMIFATFVYLLLIYVSFFSQYNNGNKSLNIVIFLSCIIFIFVFFNYLDVQRFNPLARSKNKLVSFISKFIVSLIIPMLLIIIYTHT